MKEGYWYVVDVSFRGSNPIHRAICQRKGNTVVLWGSYEAPITKRKEDLYYFDVVDTIPKMNSLK